MINAKKKIYVIINPASGTSEKEELPFRIASILDPHRFDVFYFITGYAGHGAEIAAQAVKDNVDVVVAVGGDGTVNEIGRTLVNSSVALGIIPMGSGNGLARDLKIPGNIEKAVAVIGEDHVIDIDYGVADGHVFFCTCGFGFDAVIAKKVAGEKKRGSLMYLKSVLEAFIQETPETYEIICPEGSIQDKAFILTCANATQYGYNAHIAPLADLQDGMMNIALLKPLSILDIPQTTLQLFAKTIDENKKMVTLTAKQALIKREKEGVMHIDGDSFSVGKEIDVHIVPKGLKVLVPANTPKRKNMIDPLELISKVVSSMSPR